MKLVVVLLLSVAMSIHVSSEDYESYLRSFDKVYQSSDEYSIRYQTFSENMKKIEEHNSNPDRMWDMGQTHFSDWTWEEFQETILGDPQDCSATNEHELSAPHFNKTYPQTYDWRDQGVVSPVKDQGQCGSCWTFSTTGAMESHWSIFTKMPPPMLAEQQLVDCAGNFDNHGCNGGLPSQAFEYIKYAGGITTEAQYPYTAKDGNCTVSDVTFAAHAPFGSANVTVNNEKDMLRAMYDIGPLSIAYEVIDDFMHYKSGIYSTKDCNNTSQDVNHAVLGVGFGQINGTDYWLVKNSWGTTWGDEGYFKIERGVNMCGLSDCVSWPLVGPPQP